MRGFVLWGTLLTCGAAPAYAGHGTIRETETQIIVEYYGDASDKYDAQPASSPDQPAQSPVQPPAVPLQTVAVAQPPAQTDAERAVARPQQAEPAQPSQRAIQREQALELRRKQQAERMARRLRQPGSGEDDE
ncbi:hypothetical protein [Geobacter sp. SVR]|uniref:hypothetical protein n=1 Tax=Geobacter sp. SVR TaxID=2495594 RepID=UPI00143F018C|nr:hypothetical protein [Geobacter sp. SVR]BCS53262.1 hypothetical protein GSVR_15700 [Geobacter sp. SVR]GCF84648.1 hypothetical protein GSbR_12480 [Geobacter sp. SVR]